MKKFFNAFLMLALVCGTVSTVASAAHPTEVPSYTNLRIAQIYTHMLERRAEHLHEAIEHATGFDHIADDVHEMAEAAEHLHTVLHDRKGYEHVVEDFDKLTTAYRHLKHNMRDTGTLLDNPHVARDLKRVVRLFGIIDMYIL